MSFYAIYSRYEKITSEELFAVISSTDTGRAIRCENPDETSLASLLSPEAEAHLEEMAEVAHDMTTRYFGKVIQLYTPLYLSNYCDNGCVYCGFNTRNNISRRKLDTDELRKEAEAIASTGLKHILILTGESRSMTPLGYIKDCVKILAGYFSSISIEIYPLTEDEYSDLIACGVDGLTIYQELYDQTLYAKVHPFGPKSDYRFRLDAPERGAKAGMRNVSIGVLLGLADWRKEAFLLGLHAAYLADKFPDVEIGVSVPRLRPHAGDFMPPYKISDKNIVQMIVAMRIFMPRLTIAVSTRESSRFREDIIPLGVTRMSASSTTKVGGHTIGASPASQETAQFDIMDTRNVDEVRLMLKNKGYQGVFKDWMHI